MVRVHLQRWGAVYLLGVLFLGSWVGQYVAQVAEGDGWMLFLASTFENWQSEFLQLAVQTLVVVGFANKLFHRSLDDRDQLKYRIDTALRGQDAQHERLVELQNSLTRIDRMIADQIRAGKN
jgi:hypothetical protein